jgi:hypothetical protein
MYMCTHLLHFIQLPNTYSDLIFGFVSWACTFGELRKKLLILFFLHYLKIFSSWIKNYCSKTNNLDFVVCSWSKQPVIIQSLHHSGLQCTLQAWRCGVIESSAARLTRMPC